MPNTQSTAVAPQVTQPTPSPVSSGTQVDPFASIATPIQTSQSSTADPFASIATPTPAASTTGVSGDYGAPESTMDKVGDTLYGVQAGIGKGMGDTVSGVAHLIHKLPGIGETLAPQQGITALDKNDQTKSTAEAAGKFGESVAEFATGDEILSGSMKAMKLVELAEKYPMLEKALSLAKDHPWLAKMVAETSKSAVVGGVQGAAHGAADPAGTTLPPNPFRNAAEGAVGGAVGGAIGGAASELITPIARLFGLGGLTSTEAMIKAGRPKVNEGRTFATNVERAMPLLVDADKKTPVKSVQDFVDLAHDKADDLWTNTIAPQVERHGNEVIDGAPIAQRIRQALPEGTTELFPDQAAPVEQMAQTFANSKLSLSKADGYLRTLNAELKSYYNMPPAMRYSAGITNGRLSAMAEAADALRDSIYGKLTQLGEQTPREFRQQYGALKQIENVFNKRATVEMRQAPMNLQQVLGATEAVGAVLSGHPIVAGAGLIPSIARARQSSGSLIRQGINAAKREAGGAPVRSTVKALTPNIGSQAGQAVASPDENEDQQ